MGFESVFVNNTNSRAVSPVIATILMVAVVVIISASIAAVSLGFTAQIGDSTPTAAFDFEHENDDWIITHTNGDTLEADRLQIQVTEPDGNANMIEWSNSGSVSAGDSVRISGSEDADLSILWENEDRSATLARSTGSSAGSGNSGGGGGSTFDPENNIPAEGSGWYLDGEFQEDNSDRWDEEGNLDTDGGDFQETENSQTVSIYTRGDVDDENVQNFNVKENGNDVFIYIIGDFKLNGYISIAGNNNVHIYVGGEVDYTQLDGDPNDGDLILYGDSDYLTGLEEEEDERKDVEDWPDN